MFAGSCRDIDQAAGLLLRNYGSLLGRLMFLEAPSSSLMQRISADKFVLSVRGQLRLIDLEAGSSNALRAASLLAALSRYLAMNASTVTVLAYYSCIDDIAAVRECLFMQSWSPATDSRVVLLSIVIMKLFTQFYESMAWQAARDALSKVSAECFVQPCSCLRCLLLKSIVHKSSSRVQNVFV
jgi:hypothetical protein